MKAIEKIILLSPGINVTVADNEIMKEIKEQLKSEYY